MTSKIFSTIKPQFVPRQENGRSILRLTLPPGSSLLNDVVLPYDGALSLPDALIDVDVAHFAAALAVARRECELLHHVAFRVSITSEGFAGEILSPCFFIFTTSQLDLELHFYDADGDGSGDYFLDLSSYFRCRDVEALSGWLGSLLSQT